MLETLYVMTPGISIRQDGGLLVLEKDHSIIKEVPMATVSNLVLGRTIQISTQVMFSLVKQGSLIQFVDHKYQLVGTLGDEHTTLQRLLWQAERFQNQEFALAGAKYIVRRKIKGHISLLNQYKKSKSIPNFEAVHKTLKALLKRVERIQKVDRLRGIEGLASRTYFSVLGHVLSEPWEFSGRKRHPSPDPVNAILSYGYSFLEREVRACLLTAGLDVRIGVLHSTNNRKDSFVYDVMDIFRQDIIDRFVLKLLNRHMIFPEDFDISEHGCFLSKEANKKWIEFYEAYMTTELSRLGNITPRKWIQRETQAFMSYLKSLDETVVTTEYENIS
jgi:CRISPR-associated protein Cas1